MITCGFQFAYSGAPVGADDWECTQPPGIDDLIRLNELKYSVVSREWVSPEVVLLKVQCLEGFEER